jgi:F-type H+-transporting ATPase subunit delta
MVNETLARRYAIAVASLAQERKAVDRVGEDLATIASAIGERGEIHDFFVAPVIQRDQKERVLRNAFQGKVDEIALNTLLLLVRKRREGLLGAIVAQYRSLQLSARGVEMLRLTSARDLEEAEVESILAQLQRQYAKKFEVTRVVDPSVIGGVRILMGDRRIDATIAGRLEALARELSASK